VRPGIGGGTIADPVAMTNARAQRRLPCHHGVFGYESRPLANERIRFQFVRAVGSEVIDKLAFARNHFTEVESFGRDVHAQAIGVIYVAEAFGRAQECLRRHTTAQDARAAKVAWPTDEHDRRARVARRRSRREAGGTRTDNAEVV